MKTFIRLLVLVVVGVSCVRAENWERHYDVGEVSDPADSNFWLHGLWKLQYLEGRANGKVAYTVVIDVWRTHKVNGSTQNWSSSCSIGTTSVTDKGNGQVLEFDPNTTQTVRLWRGASLVAGAPHGTFVTDPLKKKYVKVVTNDTSFDLEVYVFDGVGGPVMVHTIVRPGESKTLTLSSASGNDIRIHYIYNDAKLDAGGFLEPAPGEDLVGFETIPNGDMTIAEGSLLPTDIKKSETAGSTGTGAKAEGTGVEGVVVPDKLSTTGTGGLTEGQYAKGVNSINSTLAVGFAGVIGAEALGTAAIVKAIEDNGGTGGGGDGTDVSGVEDRLDTANEHLGLGGILGILKGGEDFDQGSQLGAAQNEADSVGEYEGVKPTLAKPTISAIGAGTPVFGEMQIGGQTLAVGLTGGIGATDTLLAAMRPMLLAAMCIGFLRTISGTLTTYTAALPQVQAQDTAVGPENLVPGMSQAKTWGTAAAAVLVVFGAAAALVALCDTMVTYYGGGIATIFAAFDLPGAAELGVIDSYVPLAAGMGLTVLGAAAPYLMAPVYLAAAAILRFLKT